jgi:hypothetical protein
MVVVGGKLTFVDCGEATHSEYCWLMIVCDVFDDRRRSSDIHHS